MEVLIIKALENAYFLNNDYSLNERSSSAFVEMEFPNSASLVFGTVNSAVELRYPSDERKRLGYGIGAEAGSFYSGNRWLTI